MLVVLTANVIRRSGRHAWNRVLVLARAEIGEWAANGPEVKAEITMFLGLRGESAGTNRRSCGELVNRCLRCPPVAVVQPADLWNGADSTFSGGSKSREREHFRQDSNEFSTRGNRRNNP